jgi:hypothetical protein
VTDFVDALRDFARSSDFQRFFAGHKPYYGTVVKSSEKLASLASAEWQAYTGLTADSRKLIVSPLLRFASANPCGGQVGGTLVTPAALLTNGSKAERLLTVQTGVLGLKQPVAPAVQEQLVSAVFARVTALSDSEAAARLEVQHEVGQGHSLVALFATRLREFEAHRDRFETLADFLPRLLAGIDEPKSDQCAPAAVTAKQESPEAKQG